MDFWSAPSLMFLVIIYIEGVFVLLLVITQDPDKFIVTKASYNVTSNFIQLV